MEIGNLFCWKGTMAIVSERAVVPKFSMSISAMIMVLVWVSPSMLYMLFHCIEYSHWVTHLIPFSSDFLFGSISCNKLQMRAYAIVRKQQPNLQQHVIKLTKEQPKIAIDGISQNRLLSPHRGGSAYAHELHNSGKYYRFSEKEEKQSNKGSLNGKEKEEKVEKVGKYLEKQPQIIPIVVSEQIHPRATRTKKLFQEFPSSPSKPKEQQQKQLKMNASPVRLLQHEQEIIQPMPPVESVAEHHPRKLKIFEHNELLPVESNNIVYQSDSKNFSCCGEVSPESHKQSQPQQKNQQSPAMEFTKIPQPETHQRHQSGKKRKIFEQFEQKDRIVEQFSYKQEKIQSKVPIMDKEKTLRIKIFDFASIPPFDI